MSSLAAKILSLCPWLAYLLWPLGRLSISYYRGIEGLSVLTCVLLSLIMSAFALKIRKMRAIAVGLNASISSAVVTATVWVLELDRNRTSYATFGVALGTIVLVAGICFLLTSRWLSSRHRPPSNTALLSTTGMAVLAVLCFHTYLGILESRVPWDLPSEYHDLFVTTASN